MSDCHCTGAESLDCTEVCPFAGGFEEYDDEEAS
jgi:hypothetical protein